MPGFLYFLPRAKQSDINQKGLARWGLSYLVDDLSGNPGEVILHARGCIGIDGVEGMVVGSSANWAVEAVKLHDGIEWKKFPKSFIQGGANGAVNGADAESIDPKLIPSIGMIKGEPLPTPADLARADQVAGKSLTLVDSHKWLIPNARVITEFGSAICNLKSSFDLDDETGDWIRGQVLPPYRKIWDHANAYTQSKMDAIASAQPGESISWEIPDWQSLVVDALQVNYRVSSRELASLGVLVTGLAQEIARILVDDDGYERLKKKAAEGTGLG